MPLHQRPCRNRPARRAPRTTRRHAARAARAALVALILATLSACSDSSSPSTPPAGTAGEWRLLGGSLERTYFNSRETRITKETAPRLVPLWRFTTGAIVTASPIVAQVDLPAEPQAQLLFIPSWDGTFYALHTRDGSLAWSHRFKPHPGASYPQAGSAAVEDLDGRRTVFVASGMTMHAFDAASGELLWEFDAGTGCTDCDVLAERNEILSSPAVLEGVVYFGMDTNDSVGKGGFFAVDARRGALKWYFDLETGATCWPNDDDHVRRFDGYHTEVELGLPAGFLATRRGCSFDRTPTQCGNVWSSATIDAARRMLYTASSNCDTDDDPDTPLPPPPMPPYDEAVFALDIDTGEPVWRWRPREVDPEDLAIGAVPNLFTAEIGGATREVVGVGCKDGTYYVLDRDGTNEITGKVEPYWQTNVVPGGAFGGIIASAAVGEGKVLFSTAIGTDIANPQRPAAWGLDAASGTVRWSNPDAMPGYAPTSAIPGVVFMGSIGGSVTAYDSDTGAELVRLAGVGPIASPAVVVDGRVFFGSGTGERGGNPGQIAFQSSLVPSPISAFCLSGSDGCPEGGSCDDGNSCTSDAGTQAGCSSEPLPDDTACTIGDLPGHCRDGACILDATICPDTSQCTRPVAGRRGCTYEAEPDGTACTVRDAPGECRSGSCVSL